MSYKNLWMIMSNGNADSSKATAFGAFVGFSLPLSDLNKSIPHQKAEGPVRVFSLFRHAGDVQIPTTVRASQQGLIHSSLLLMFNCYQCNFFMLLPLHFSGTTAFFNISKTIVKLKCPWCTTRLSFPRDFNPDKGFVH